MRWCVKRFAPFDAALGGIGARTTDVAPGGIGARTTDVARATAVCRAIASLPFFHPPIFVAPERSPSFCLDAALNKLSAHSTMAILHTKKLVWQSALVRRAEPRRARVFFRVALWLAAVPLALSLVSKLLLSPAPPLVAAIVSWSQLLFVASLFALLLSLFKSRGVARKGAFALEARSLFIDRGSTWRRIPRRTIETATLRPMSATVSLILTSGVVETLDLRDRDRARMLVAELSRLPARASPT